MNNETEKNELLAFVKRIEDRIIAGEIDNLLCSFKGKDGVKECVSYKLPTLAREEIVNFLISDIEFSKRIDDMSAAGKEPFRVF